MNRHFRSRSRFPHVLLALLASVLLAACSTPPATRVTLLPQEGKSSAVVVTTAGGEAVLSKPYQRAVATEGATTAPRLEQADPGELRKTLAPLFELAPPPAQRYTVFFDTGNATLTAESQATMERVLAAALALSGGDIVITGHTDTTGTGPANDKLSVERARQVRQMLVERQFPAARIEAAGRGERELAVQTPDETDEPRNRRVTIEVR
ncbi:MAG: OmpA family protein [Comamonadaceae bacterium]|nr:MAG: OmpA family protein [Comamonadaceae bacterium]